MRACVCVRLRVCVCVCVRACKLTTLTPPFHPDLCDHLTCCPPLGSVAELRETVSQEHQRAKEKEQAQAPKASYGYGGKFGVERDRMDKVNQLHPLLLLLLLLY